MVEGDAAPTAHSTATATKNRMNIILTENRKVFANRQTFYCISYQVFEMDGAAAEQCEPAAAEQQSDAAPVEVLDIDQFCSEQVALLALEREAEKGQRVTALTDAPSDI